MKAAAVPVGGGELAALVWEASGEATHAARDALPVLGVHGITANAAAFGRLAAELGGRRLLIAPDLRGRAGSAGLPGPFGLARHVGDLIAVLDHLDIDRAILVGHSMGAFVGCLTAARHPERVGGVVLVDGGLALPMPADTDIDAMLGPAMARLGMTFADLDTYRAFWQAHPAFEDRWNEYSEAYIRRDLTGQPPALRSACNETAIRADGADVLGDPDTLGAVHRMPRPARLLWASRGLMDESPGLYTPERLAELNVPLPARELADENHYSVLFSSAVREIVAEIDAVAEQSVHA
ncbi:alpha/beta fold hydrolase [Phytoactinopolyspora mesophila]|uniref:Alpha/beta fold hydrolase n=1 Tax=Phytoactinopolyspora mesophila TaxID=2650750 RepID=A0A7K3M1J4_9ACTN|nr:alpha/beta hydrolase [Phytoactinopolyspora mesophila]NDL57166.1 alpha/beta fold hydrolase [Phytoactinopolyspora mesophila]